MTAALLVIGAILGAVAGVALQEWVNSLRLRVPWGGRSEFTGSFSEELQSYAVGEFKRPNRQDRVVAKQRGNRIWGEIRRQQPSLEGRKRWHFRGYVDGGLLVAAFWTITPSEDPTSYGTIVMHRDGPNVWAGRYWRPGTVDDAKSALRGDALPGHPITWRKSA